MECFTYGALAAKGKPCLRNLAMAVRCIDIFRNGMKNRCLQNYGNNSLLEDDALRGIDGTWQSIEGATTKAALGGKTSEATPLVAAK